MVHWWVYRSTRLVTIWICLVHQKRWVFFLLTASWFPFRSFHVWYMVMSMDIHDFPVSALPMFLPILMVDFDEYRPIIELYNVYIYIHIYIFIHIYTYNITTCINYLLQHVPRFLRIKHLDLSRSLIKIRMLMFKWAIKLDYTIFYEWTEGQKLMVHSKFLCGFSSVFFFWLSKKKQMENMENTSLVASHVFSPNCPSWDLRYIPMVGWLIEFPAWPSNRSMIEDVKCCKYQTGSNLICPDVLPYLSLFTPQFYI